MVLYAEVIKSKTVFHVAWLLGTGDSRKLSRRDILSQDLPELCVQITAMMPEKNISTETKTGLYLLSLLTYGTVLIHRTQVEFLQRDTEKLKELMRKKSFIMLMAEKFDRQQEIQNTQNNHPKLRSTPIACIEDIDELVNLADLPLISEQLGINGDPRDFTMMDALPNFTQWSDANTDLSVLYGSVEPYYSPANVTLHSTFVEGNGSDEQSREKRSAAVLYDFDHIVVPQRRDEHLAPIKTISRKRPAIMEREVMLDELLVSNREPIANNYPDELRRGTEPTFPEEEKAPLNSLLEPPLEEPQARLPVQLEEPDLIEIPANQQNVMTAYLNSLTSLAKDDINLPPIPIDLDLFDDGLQPHAKKLRTDATEDVEFLEKARRRASSRPLTPINQTDLTDLHSTLKTDEQTVRTEGREGDLTIRDDERAVRVEEPTTRVTSPTFELDSQIHFPPPQKKRSKRNLPVVYGDDLEIDEAVRQVLEADWSSLVRKKEDALMKLPGRTDNYPVLMFDPEPMLNVGYRLPDQVRELFRSSVFNGYIGTEIDESDEVTMREEPEKFGYMSLLSPYRLESPVESREQLEQRDLFDDVHRPLQIDDFFTINQDVLPVEKLPEPTEFETYQLPEKVVESPPVELKYAFTNLLSTPEKQREAAIIEDLNLEPVPIEQLNHDFSNQTMRQIDPFNTNITNEGVENVRQRQKSSMGFGNQMTEELEEDSDDIQRRLRAFDREERIRLAMEAKEDDVFFYSSGSLLPNNRFIIHAELLNQAEANYPQWIDFNQLTSGYTRKKAATAFEGLLLGLKYKKVYAKQEEPFGTIYVQHIAQ